MEIVKIKIHNWNKYQLATSKMPHWFRVNIGISTSESLFGLNHSTKWTWICLMARAMERKCEEFELNITWASALWEIKKKDLVEAIEILSKRNLLGVNSDSTPSSVGVDSVLHYTTDITNKTNNTYGQNKFDLECLYFLYPRKIGKKEGLKKLRQLIKTQADFDNVKTAINNYSNYCKSKDPRYIKHFDSFLSVWEDYRDQIVEPKSHSINPEIFEGTPA